MSASLTPPQPRLALVTRAESRTGAPPCYLVLSEAGEPQWTDDSQRATAFASMREAARMALRLPANLRAFGLPVPSEGTLH